MLSSLELEYYFFQFIKVNAICYTCFNIHLIYMLVAHEYVVLFVSRKMVEFKREQL